MFIWGSARLGERPIGGQEQQPSILGSTIHFEEQPNKSAVTAPQNEPMKKTLENGSFLTQIVNRIGHSSP